MVVVVVRCPGFWCSSSNLCVVSFHSVFRLWLWLRGVRGFGSVGGVVGIVVLPIWVDLGGYFKKCKLSKNIAKTSPRESFGASGWIWMDLGGSGWIFQEM